jgi:dTDP-glucose 4,6-dehydratase
MSQFSKTILVTGGAGFIGANFIEYFSARHPDIRLVDLDALTYAAHPQAWVKQKAMANVEPVQGDICDVQTVAELFSKFDVTGVIHFAAESHVDNSIRDPLRFVRTNVDGTAVLLTEALRFWKKQGVLDTARFHHISTDEVYGTLGSTGYFTEKTPYAPSSPYSSSKASADMIVRAYVRTYGLNATISNCSNNYGPWQHAEKLIPTVIRKALAGEPIPIYGNGKNVRDWLWVIDHCRAIEKIFFDGRKGESYNVGGHNERNNLEITGKICDILDRLRPLENGASHRSLVTFVADRPGHDLRYAIDPSKIVRELGWHAETTFDEGIKRTVEWYLGEGAELLKLTGKTF